MKEILTEILNFISLNADTMVLSIATAVVAVIVFVVKKILTRLDELVAKTENTLDDKILAKVKEALKNELTKI